jgi:hypothetical protein
MNLATALYRMGKHSLLFNVPLTTALSAANVSCDGRGGE